MLLNKMLNNQSLLVNVQKTEIEKATPAHKIVGEIAGIKEFFYDLCYYIVVKNDFSNAKPQLANSCLANSVIPISISKKRLLGHEKDFKEGDMVEAEVFYGLDNFNALRAFINTIKKI